MEKRNEGTNEREKNDEEIDEVKLVESKKKRRQRSE